MTNAGEVNSDIMAKLAFVKADRMRKSLTVANVSVQEIAEYLGVTRNTVGNWINGRIEPSVQTTRLWALRTGVPYAWLEDGDTPSPAPPVPPVGLEPTTCGLKGPRFSPVTALRLAS